jgi:hypothetical protein
MRAWIAITVVSILLAASAPAQVPVPIVERTTTQGDVSTRVSVFSDRTVVVTIREGGVQGFVRLMEVPQDSYIVYLTTLQTNASELDEEPISSSVGTSNSMVELILYVGPDAPKTFRFSPMASLSLPLSKIMGAVNDLEQQVRESSPSAFELKSWQPKRGDRVQLMNGTYARVVEVWEDGLVVLEYEETFIREMVPPDRYDDVILHVVDPQQ